LSSPDRLHLFEAFGVELEHMIVGAESLDVLPISDRLLAAQAGKIVADIDVDVLSWSNELVLHVIELKTNGPAFSLDPLAQEFHRHVRMVNGLLAPLGARLMPTAMHPWMDPTSETRLWPHDCSPIYEAFDRIFGCRGHGWSNVQSIHLNLPFAGDEEFGRLHAAIRLLIPIMPAIAASSPVLEGRLTGLLDSRLEAYRTNAARIPSVTGAVIPEPLYTRRDYKEQILGRIYRDLAPHDPEGTLRHEWANARGAIARFDRDTIEIRVLDMQECPKADLAIVQIISQVLRALTEERWTDQRTQRKWPAEPLAAILHATIRDADCAVIGDRDYLRQFGLGSVRRCTAGELWQHLAGIVGGDDALAIILERGPLARRILRAVGADVSRVRAVYADLCQCLAENRMFQPSPVDIPSIPT
jgi:carboxylate-amine ligase